MAADCGLCNAAQTAERWRGLCTADCAAVMWRAVRGSASKEAIGPGWEPIVKGVKERS